MKFFIIPLLALALMAFSSAQWWNSSWMDRTIVNVTEPLGLNRSWEPMEVNVTG